MAEVNKGILDNDVVISAENIQKMGEIIALTCIKTVIVRASKELNHLYVRLIDDINHSKNSTRPFSDAYDIAQEAMLFLCEHIGEKLGDDYTTKYGKTITIRSACFRHTDRYLNKQYTAHITHTISLDERITAEPETILDDEQKNDYTVVDGLIAKMKLTAAEYETLSILMAGFTMLQIGRILNVNRTTIWRRKMSLQRKYALATNIL